MILKSMASIRDDGKFCLVLGPSCHVVSADILGSLVSGGSDGGKVEEECSVVGQVVRR